MRIGNFGKNTGLPKKTAVRLPLVNFPRLPQWQAGRGDARVSPRDTPGADDLALNSSREGAGLPLAVRPRIFGFDSKFIRPR